LYINHLWWLWLHDWVLNWWLNCVNWVCDWICAQILGFYTWEQIGNLVFSPNEQLSSDENIRNSSLSLCEISPRWANFAWARDIIVYARQLSLSKNSLKVWVVLFFKPRSGEKDPSKQENPFACYKIIFLLQKILNVACHKYKCYSFKVLWERCIRFHF